MPRFFILWTLDKIEALMFKYKNVSLITLILEINGLLKSIKPNQEFQSKCFINNKFLVEITEKPQLKEVKKNRLNNDS